MPRVQQTKWGTFDITVGPLMRAWGFFRGQGRYPAPWQLDKAREKVGWEKVQLDATRGPFILRSMAWNWTWAGLEKGTRWIG